MRQLGNVAIVCAGRSDVLLQIFQGQVTVHVGRGPQRTVLHGAWDDDEEIRRMIHELNFGKFSVAATA